jgi:gliding motility-associated-like protein
MNLKSTANQLLLAFVCLLVSFTKLQAQSFEALSSAVWLNDCSQNNFFNTTGSGAQLIGPASNVFDNSNIGVFTQNSGSLTIGGAEIRTHHEALAGVCTAKLLYRVYLQSATPGAFTTIDIPLQENCDVPNGSFPGGGSCATGDQKWSTFLNTPIDLTAGSLKGNYVLEVFYEITGKTSGSGTCDSIITIDNAGSPFKARFAIQSPELTSNNPTTCNGTEGLITIGGLVAGANYEVNYTDDGVPVGPVAITANGAGQVIINDLDAGVYANFELLINGCSTELFTGIILSNPVFTPTFTKINAFCAGTIQPILPLISNNGVMGTWSPATVNNMASGSYTFTPTGGQCALPYVMNITVTPKTTPSFPFGTSRTICAGEAVPVLPNTSTNGIAGTWNPAVVNNTVSGTYTFTPAATACANPTTFTVAVTPNETPTFGFGTALTLCEGETAPALPSTSGNGISGTWNTTAIDNQNSATYTFTPTAGQCAVATTLTVTVTPKTVPSFSFGLSQSICAESVPPVLTSTSLEGITGTWNPAVVNPTASGVYTFTPTDGLCALPTNFTVTVTPNATPVFDFGTALTICANENVPVLPGNDLNGITGTWSPAVVDKLNSAIYTFTPTAGLCATTASFTVTVKPNITPVFSFGTSVIICANATPPVLHSISQNGIPGTWSRATINNQVSGAYTFTPVANLCAVPATIQVTVTPNVTPTFGFGNSQTICEGETVPVLPATSIEGINGTWSPATISNTASGTYTFTPSAGQCALPASFTVTITPKTVPSFPFGSSLTICAGEAVPVLLSTSVNGVNGTWSPAIVNNTQSGTYTFTPDPGNCATTVTFAVAVNSNITPVFNFGTATTICAGGVVPVLPTTSTNGISGTWSPSVVSDQTSGVYTFTPTTGLCALPTNFTVTITPNVTPTFSFGTSLAICADGNTPALPATSQEGITGTWSPAVISKTASGSYTFTPANGQCATTATLDVTVTPNTIPSFGFGTSLVICENETVPVLPLNSDNGVPGTWTPAMVSNTASAVYTFTPQAGVCAVPTTFTVTVNPNITPSFNFGTGLTICEGGNAPLLPAVSTNGINGSWNPAVATNNASNTYTFTPALGQCALPTTFTMTVVSNVVPTFSFGNSLSICAGGTVPTLPAVSDNGINGTWSPATVSDQQSGTYTFTPSNGQCASTVVFTVDVSPNITPAFSFGTSLNVCAGATVPVLPTTSTNGITGTWNPAIVDNHSSGVYTFTPSNGVCAIPVNFSVTANPVITPTFSFGSSITMCAGENAPQLPGLSSNNIPGTWNPATIDNQSSGVYTFTPAAGECAIPVTLQVNVSPTVTPTFSFGTSLTICAGGTVPALPNTSVNGISGTWTPAVVSDVVSATYTFTPTSGICATTAGFSVVVNANITPTFSFGTSVTICNGDNAPALPSTSENGITGTWSFPAIDNQNSRSYTFTPNAGQCATIAALNVTVNPIVVPTFSFGNTATICSGDNAPTLPTTSTNGVTGSWSPATVDNQANGVYTFTPSAGQCATPFVLTMTVTPSIIPVFDFGTAITICTGGTAPVLPATSTNGVTGTWSAATISNQSSATYTFTPNATPEQCIRTVVLTVTVKAIVTPAFSFGTAKTICSGSTAPVLPTTSDNGIKGTWNPAVVNNQVAGTYIFTSSPGQCATATASFTVTITQTPTAGVGDDITVTDGTTVPASNFSGTPADVTFRWNNSDPSIGLPASGTGNTPSFTATNKGNSPVTATITVTPMNNGCAGTDKSYKITVTPLDKDVFVPNVFSPNGDGKNDLLYAYGNYIRKLDLRIFNQWGEQVITITDPKKGWDGTHRGKPQPVGVYVYVMQAELEDGRTVKLKGSITLLR